jgi:hypothetical protein
MCSYDQTLETILQSLGLDARGVAGSAGQADAFFLWSLLGWNIAKER